MNATVFGAGNIGRGLVGVVLDELGYRLTFVDAQSELVSRLADAGTYEVRFSDGESRTVTDATYLDASDESAVVDAVASSSLIATAVGEAILMIVADPIGQGLAASEVDDVNVLACENVHPNSPLLREHVRSVFGGDVADRAGFPEVIVDRIVGSAPGSVELTTESAYEFIVDRSDWRGPEPAGGITLVDDISAYEKRKLWLVNGLHASMAFLGLQAGHTFAHEAMADRNVAAEVEGIANAMVQILETEYPDFPRGEFAQTAQTSLQRFRATELPDKLTRIARNPLPKLARDERVLGPAIEAASHDLPTAPFAKVIAAMLTIDDSTVVGVDDLRSAMDDGGWRSLLSDAPAPLLDEIERQMERQEGDEMVTREIVIANPAGLHARPAALIIEKAKTMSAKIQITKGEKSANAASMMSVLSLGGKTGDTVTVSAEGGDAAEAVDFICDLLTSTEAL